MSLPRPDVPLVDTSGLMSREWYRFFSVFFSGITAQLGKRGAGSVFVGNSTATIVHGGPIGLTTSDIIVSPTSSMAASGVNSLWVSSAGPTTFNVSTNAAVTGTALNFAWDVRISA